MVRGFSFLADQELLNRMQQVDAELANVTPQELNADRAIGERLGAALQQMREHATNPAAIVQSVRRFKAIQVT